jgi:hypothetical protein
VLYQIAKTLAAWRGYELCQVDRKSEPTYPPDFTPEEIATWDLVGTYTMTSPERIVSLTRAIEYIYSHSLSGDIVECGVWRGGSMMAIARTLLRLGDTSRMLHLFDTFEGMPPPRDVDRSCYG